MTNEQIRPLVTSITSIIGENTGLEESFFEMVLQRLESLSYTYTENDAWMLAFSMQKVENHIKNSCNTTSIPDGLMEVAVDKVCGEFLFAKKQTGNLDSVFNLEVSIKSVQAGDTNVTFSDNGSQTSEQRLNSLLTYLMTKGEGDFTCYRKIKW